MIDRDTAVNRPFARIGAIAGWSAGVGGWTERTDAVTVSPMFPRGTAALSGTPYAP